MPTTESDEIQYILTTIPRMEAERLNIKMNQVTLFRRLNELVSTPRALPHEILVDIFAYVCANRWSSKTTASQGSSYIKYPLIQTISQICSSWRNIAKSVPSLWTRFSIDIPDEQSAPRGSLNVLQLYLDNAAPLPISISLLDALPASMDPPPGRPSTRGARVPYVELLRLIFCQNPARISSTTLETYPHDMPGWRLRGLASAHDSDHRVVYPNLTRLVLMDLCCRFSAEHYSSAHLFKGAGLPHLRHLFLHCYPTPNHLSFDNLVTLHLSNATPRVAFAILAQASRVIEIHAVKMKALSYSSPNSDSEFPESTNPSTGIITLSHLKIMAWDFTNFEWAEKLMTSFHFPVLERLFYSSDGRQVRITRGSRSL